MCGGTLTRGSEGLLAPKGKQGGLKKARMGFGWMLGEAATFGLEV